LEYINKEIEVAKKREAAESVLSKGIQQMMLKNLGKAGADENKGLTK